MNKDRYRIGNVFISITDPNDTYKRIVEAAKRKKSGYVCFSNMRTVTIANNDEQYRKIVNNSLLSAPDGMPLVWCGRSWGIKDACRSMGPIAFDRVLSSQNNVKQFLLGDTNETLNKVSEKYTKEYGTNIVGIYSPPFAPIENYNLEEIVQIIKNSGAEIVWTSLRAPKQDILNSKLSKFTENVLFIGVGTAFRYSIGEYGRQAPKFFQKTGLNGFFLLRNTNFFKETKWYVKHTLYLVFFITQILYFRLIGRKYFE